MTARNKGLIKALVVLFVIFIFLNGGLSALKVLSTGGVGYISGYEGARARYAGVLWDNEQTQTGDSTLFWDGDGVGSGCPAIVGEMTSVFVPQESVGEQPFSFGSGADITDWLLGSTTTRNPVQTYEWTFGEGNDSSVYRMEEWRLKWYFSISAEPSGAERPTSAHLGGWTRFSSWTQIEVWFELNVEPIWYFEGADHAYFAIAQLRVSDVAVGGKFGGKESGYETEPLPECRVAPMSAGSVLPLYYGIFGSEANRAEKTAYEYRGRRLNPQLFTDRVYTKYSLNDFGLSEKWDWGVFWKGDVVTVGVDVNVFVVGEWKVKEIQELPEDYGRDAKYGGGGLGWGEMFFAMLNDPAGRLMLAILGIIGLFLVLAIFAPSVLIMVFALFGTGRRRQGG